LDSSSRKSVSASLYQELNLSDIPQGVSVVEGSTPLPVGRLRTEFIVAFRRVLQLTLEDLAMLQDIDQGSADPLEIHTLFSVCMGFTQLQNVKRI
jgi:hypothetical protein